MTHKPVPGADLGPLSPAGFAAYAAGVDPPAEMIAPGTYVVPIPMPGGGIVTSTLCYVLSDGQGRAHLIDPGLNSEVGWQRLTHALADWGMGSVASVVVTHMHLDHLGMAERVRQEWGARLIMGRTEWRTYRATPSDADRVARYDAWGVPVDRRPVMPPELTVGYASEAMGPQHMDSPPDRLVDDGDQLDMGRPIQVMVTPGHTDGGLSLRDDQQHWICTGDQVLPHMHPALGLDYAPDGDPVGDFLDAAERLARFDGYAVLPGHGFQFQRLAHRLDQISAHHLRRSRQVRDVVADMPDATVWELASRLHWTRGFENLEGYLLNSALQQTEMHRTFVRSARSAPYLSHDTSTTNAPSGT
ncbi:MAG: MBL fold metallo-hydrolase [Propionibacteriaceae bacterium]|nr:MBL fold metallo-hydrolase [Propionibacteriaceae bacterium]